MKNRENTSPTFCMSTVLSRLAQVAPVNLTDLEFNAVVNSSIAGKQKLIALVYKSMKKPELEELLQQRRLEKVLHLI